MRGGGGELPVYSPKCGCSDSFIPKGGGGGEKNWTSGCTFLWRSSGEAPPGP